MIKTYLGFKIPYKYKYVVVENTKFTISSVHIIKRYQLRSVCVRFQTLQVCCNTFVRVKKKSPRKRP
jgi:hypothetical protein